MLCLTPNFTNIPAMPNLPYGDRSGEAVYNYNQGVLFTVNIGLILDGVPTYVDLSTHPTLAQYSSMDVYFSVNFTSWGPTGTMVFVSTWPINQKVLEIKVGG